MNPKIILVILTCLLTQIASAAPAQLIEPGTKIHLSDEIKKTLVASAQKVFVQDKKLVSENEVNTYREYCEIRGSAETTSRVIDRVTYIVGNLVDWTTNLELRSDDFVVYNPFIVECRTKVKFEFSTEEVESILGDLLCFLDLYHIEY